MPLQVAGLTNNLTTEYNNFLNFLTTTPTAIQTLINDAKLLNAQLNAVCPRAPAILLHLSPFQWRPDGARRAACNLKHRVLQCTVPLMSVHHPDAHWCVAVILCCDLLQPVPLVSEAVLNADDRGCLPQRCQVDQHWNAVLRPERTLHSLGHTDRRLLQRAALQCGPLPHHLCGAGRQHQPAADPDLPTYLPD